MIFSIVCEELGVFGAALLLLMFGYLLYRLFFIAQNAPDLYGTLVVTGIFVHIVITGNPEPLRSIESDAYNRYHASICQLRRYVDPVLMAEMELPECVGKDPDDGRRHHGG